MEEVERRELERATVRYVKAAEAKATAINRLFEQELVFTPERRTEIEAAEAEHDEARREWYRLMGVEAPPWG